MNDDFARDVYDRMDGGLGEDLATAKGFFQPM